LKFLSKQSKPLLIPETPQALHQVSLPSKGKLRKQTQQSANN